MRKSAQYAAFDRPKSNRPKKMTKRHLALLVALMASAAPIGLTVAADATTDYDRNKNPRPEKSWHAVEASEAPTTVNIGRLGSENGTSNYKVAPNGVVVPEVFDRIKNTEGYIEMQARTEQQDETFTEYEDRVGTLEGLDRHWNYDPSLDIASAWVTTNDPRITDWAPAIHRQLSGFQQSATFRVSQKRPVEEYEKNYVNGDERLTNIRTEQRTFDETRTRRVDVAIGSWSNTGGLYDCTTWSPATNTVNQGASFTQSQTCKQNQQRNVSYTVASTGANPGGAWTDTKTINVSQDRAATGTKPTKWKHNKVYQSTRTDPWNRVASKDMKKTLKKWVVDNGLNPNKVTINAGGYERSANLNTISDQNFWLAFISGSRDIRGQVAYDVDWMDKVTACQTKRAGTKKYRVTCNITIK